MKIYTVHARPFWKVNEDDAADQSIALVREGFDWFALVFPLLWALWHRLWLVAAVFAVSAVVLNLAVTLLAVADLYVSLLSSGILIWIGFEANDLRRWSLRRSGWRELGIISGRNRNEAEWRFFDRQRTIPTGAAVA